MNFWVLTILRLGSRLEYMADRLERRAENIASSLLGDTVESYNKILELNDKKILVINLYVMLKAMFKELNNEERTLIKGYSQNFSLCDIGMFLGVSRSTVMRRLNKTVKKCISVLTALGYSEKRLKDEYRGFTPVYNTYLKIRKEHYLKVNAAKGDVETRKTAANTHSGNNDSYKDYFGGISEEGTLSFIRENAAAFASAAGVCETVKT